MIFQGQRWKYRQDCWDTLWYSTYHLLPRPLCIRLWILFYRFVSKTFWSLHLSFLCCSEIILKYYWASFLELRLTPLQTLEWFIPCVCVVMTNCIPLQTLMVRDGGCALEQELHTSIVKASCNLLSRFN